MQEHLRVVSLRMFTKRRTISVLLATNFTQERLLSSVNPAVPGQFRGVTGVLPTHLTLERHFTSVGLEVCVQVG